MQVDPHPGSIGKVRTLQGDAKEALLENEAGGVPTNKEAWRIPEEVHEIISAELEDAEDDVYAKRNETVFDVTRAFNNNTEFGGSIITDKKAKRLGIFGAVQGAVEEWIETAKENVDGLKIFEKKPEARVNPVETRRKVVEKAGMFTAPRPQNDYHLIEERLKNQKYEPIVIREKPVLIKEKTVEVAPTWTHVIDENGTEVRSMGGETVNARGKAPEGNERVDREKTKQELESQFGKDITPQKAETQMNDRPTVQRIERVSVTPKKSEASVSQKEALGTGDSQPRVLPEFREAVRTERPQNVEVVQRVLQEEPAPPPVVFTRPEPVNRVTEKRSSPLLMGVKVLGIATVIIVVVSGGIWTAVTYIKSDTEPEVVTEVEPEDTFVVDDALHVLVEGGGTMFLSALRQEILSSAESYVTYIPYRRSGSGGEELLQADQVLTYIAPSTNGTFRRSLDQVMHFGGIRTTGMEPFILLRFTSFDIAFAGMLDWETQVGIDLAPIFVTPSDEGPTDMRALRFTDMRIGEVRTRVLKSADGRTIMLYGFLDNKTLVITTSEEALLKIKAELNL